MQIMQANNMREIVRGQVSLERREQLLQGMTAATEELLRAEGLDEALEFRAAVHNALEHVATVLGADAAYIFEFCADPFGDEPIACRRYHWFRPSTTEHPNDERPNESYATDLSHASALGHWSHRLADGEFICAPVSELPPPERAVLEARGVERTMVLPIFTGNQLWGGLRFDAWSTKVRWDEAEATLLQTLAENFGIVLGEWVRNRRSGNEHAPPSLSDSSVLSSNDTVSLQGSLSIQDNAAPLSGFAIVAPDGQLLYQSPDFSGCGGHEKQAINAAGGLTACLPDAETQTRVQEVLQAGTSFFGTLDLGGTAKDRPVHLKIQPIHNEEETHLCSLCWLSPEKEEDSTSPTSLQQAIRLEQRVRTERALVQASQLLVSAGSFEMEELLRIVGEATGADHAYLVIVTPDDEMGPVPLSVSDPESSRPPIQLDAYTEFEWSASGVEPEFNAEETNRENGRSDDQDAMQTFAVPILSSDDQLYGYLGIEYAESWPLQDEDARVLNVLGDMLCTYLQRKISEKALRRSERRYRHFVDTISEAIWRVEINPPLQTDQSVEAQVEHLLQEGSVVECNGEMAQLFGLERPEQLIGWDVETVTKYVGRKIIKDVVKAGYRLRNKELAVRGKDGQARHFIINTVGVIKDQHLVGLWGSCTEVTDRVELERRMVTALEQQQQRIGRDLHDSVGQLLTGVRMLAQNLAERHLEKDSPGLNQIEKIIGYTNEATQHVSDLQRGLMPVQMERGGLAQALRELASNTDVFPDVECIYVHDGETDVHDQEIKLQIYRIAQEATNNALKHANPSYIKIVLKTQDDHVMLQVEDDGSGFETSRHSDKSLGLHSMYYRARSINGSLEIDSEPGSGTTVQCLIPCSELAHDEVQVR